MHSIFGNFNPNEVGNLVNQKRGPNSQTYIERISDLVLFGKKPVSTPQLIAQQSRSGIRPQTRRV